MSLYNYGVTSQLIATESPFWGMLEIPWRDEIDGLCSLLKFYVKSFTLWLRAWFLSFWGKIFKTEMKFLMQLVHIEKNIFILSCIIGR